MSRSDVARARRAPSCSGAVLALAVLGSGIPVVAAAQPPAEQTPPAAPPPIVAGYDEGFFIASADGRHRLTLGAIVHTDVRFAPDAATPLSDTFTLRRARPVLAGQVARAVAFRFMSDFAGGQAVVLDAYVDVRLSPRLRVRTGKDKTPVGYELLIGETSLVLPERSLASGLVPNRDVGVQVQGEAGSWLAFAGGVFDGVPDGTSAAAEPDGDTGTDVAGRVVVRPFRRAGGAGPLAGLGVHVGGSAGRQVGALPAFRTTAGRTFFRYAAGAAADGVRTRVTPALFYHAGPFGAFAEHVLSRQAMAGAEAPLVNEAWNLTATYVLTGEAASERTVQPRRPFDPASGGWGAVQVVARLSRLDVDAAAFARGLAAAGAARQARALAVGLNWVAAPVLKVYASYERTRFAVPAPPAIPTEHIVILRLQLGV